MCKKYNTVVISRQLNGKPMIPFKVISISEKTMKEIDNYMSYLEEAADDVIEEFLLEFPEFNTQNMSTYFVNISIV